MRWLSFPMRRALQAEATDEIAVLLVTITHADLEEPIRLSSHALTTISVDPFVMGVRSGGHDYVHLIQSYALPDDPESGAPTGRLAVVDILGSLRRAAKVLIDHPTVDFDIVLASSPDTIEDGLHDEIEVASATWQAGVLTLDLQAVDYDEPVPAHRMSKRHAPGLHK
jgi:hypothetical protein